MGLTIRRLKWMYATTALAGALLMNLPPISPVHAQQIVTVDELNRLEDRFETKHKQIDEHLESTDKRVNELSDRLSLVQGIGGGALGVMGIAQGLILILKKGGE